VRALKNFSAAAAPAAAVDGDDGDGDGDGDVTVGHPLDWDEQLFATTSCTTD
jgi:hypothetical protein